MSSLLEDLYENISFEPESAEARDETGEQRFRITNQNAAIWALRKIRLINSRLEEAETTASAEINIIENWLKDQQEKASRERSFFEGLLREYMEDLRREDPKLKTMKLPGGELAFRKQQAEYSYDEAQLLPWAKEHLPEAVHVKESILKSVVKDYVNQTGEVLPGVRIDPRPDKFTVRVNK